MGNWGWNKRPNKVSSLLTATVEGDLHKVVSPDLFMALQDQTVPIHRCSDTQDILSHLLCLIWTQSALLLSVQEAPDFQVTLMWHFITLFLKQDGAAYKSEST